MKNILKSQGQPPFGDVAINDMSPLNLVFLKVLAFGGRFETAAFAQGSPDGRMVTITSSNGFLPFVFGFCAQGLPVDFENPSVKVEDDECFPEIHQAGFLGEGSG